MNEIRPDIAVRPRRLVLASVLAAWVAMILACAGKDGGGKGGEGGSGDAGGGDTAAAKVGQEVNFDDSTWIVVAVTELGKTAPSNNQFQKDLMADEGTKYIQVQYKVTNKTKKEERLLMNAPKIKDSEGREFKHIDQEAFYIPKGAKTISMEALPPSIPKEFYGVFLVPADAKGLKFEVSPMSAFGKKKLVELGL